MVYIHPSNTRSQKLPSGLLTGNVIDELERLF